MRNFINLSNEPKYSHIMFCIIPADYSELTQLFDINIFKLPECVLIKNKKIIGKYSGLNIQTWDYMLNMLID